MRRLSPEELRARLKLDFQVCQYMFGAVFSGEAYRTSSDMEKRVNQITAAGEGHLARKYRVDIHVKTLIAKGKFADVTTISFDLDVAGYPFEKPATQILSSHTPYSPHFKRGAPVCIGEIWGRAQGHMLLGQLLVHIARLLNWDETARGGGYVGWNADAIAYHKQVYGDRPLDENLQYPTLPPDLYDIDPDKPEALPPSLFKPISRRPPPAAIDSSLFRGKERRNG